MSRKTVPVEFIKDRVNYFLANSTSGSEARHMVASLLEAVLHESKNYHGFRYLNTSEVPANCEPGIVWDHENNRAISYPDATRRKYS